MSLGAGTQGQPVQWRYVQKCLVERDEWVPNSQSTCHSEKMCALSGDGESRLGKRSFLKFMHTEGMLLLDCKEHKDCLWFSKKVSGSPAPSHLFSPSFPELHPQKWAWGKRRTMPRATPHFWEDSILFWETLESPGEKVLYKHRQIPSSLLHCQENSMHTMLPPSPWVLGLTWQYQTNSKLGSVFNSKWKCTPNRGEEEEKQPGRQQCVFWLRTPGSFASVNLSLSSSPAHSPSWKAQLPSLEWLCIEDKDVDNRV